MIRIELENDWLLLSHPEHAALAGEFARRWKNQHFAPPEPFAHVLDAVSRHDDSWAPRDALPCLTRENNPSAFSRELVGSYDAFEEIDLADYLRVRGEATEAAAERDPYAAILISMHTVNLLTEQADLSTLDSEGLALHTAFIDGQRQRQQELIQSLQATPDLAPYTTEASLQAGFKFLQACDSFSLYVGVAYPEAGQLRHAQPMRDGRRATITLTPVSADSYSLDPYPLDEPGIRFEVPYRRVSKAATIDLQTFQAAYAAAPVEWRGITVQPA
jgi:hypothetical protein